MQSYLDLLQDIIDNGESHNDRTGVGTLSVFGRQWRHRMTEGFPLLTTKYVAPGWVWDELQWFLSGSSCEEDLRTISIANGRRPCDIWKEWATEEQCGKFQRNAGDMGLIYGRLWRGFPVGYSSADPRAKIRYMESVDQIQQLCDDLIHNPESRRLIVSGWHPYYQKRVTLPPCHTLFQLKVHPKVSYKRDSASHFETVQGEGLSLHLYARSIDAFLGLPFNIASYSFLLTLLAHATSRIAWDLIISFGDLHIYNNHREQVNVQLKRTPRPLPYLIWHESLRGRGFDAVIQAKGKDWRLYNYDHDLPIKAPVAV